MKILEYYGTDYNIGLSIGRFFKDILKTQASAYAHYLQEENIAEYIRRELRILYNTMPDIYEELRGRSDGSEVSLEMITLLSSPEILRKEDGCTTVAVKQEDGHILLAHNEDEDDFTTENSGVFIYHYEDLDVYAYTNAMKLPGSCVGWNSAGMIYTSNYLFYEEPDLDRVSRYIACAAIYRCRSAEEAAEYVQNMKTASPFSINILDTRTNEFINIEKDLDTCYITAVQDKFSRSNHFLHKETRHSVSSEYRLHKSRELLQGDIRTLKDVTDITDYVGTDDDHTIHIPGYNKDHGRTVTNLSCDTKEKIVVLRDFLENTTVRFSLDQ